MNRLEEEKEIEAAPTTNSRVSVGWMIGGIALIVGIVLLIAVILIICVKWYRCRVALLECQDSYITKKQVRTAEESVNALKDFETKVGSLRKFDYCPPKVTSSCLSPLLPQAQTSGSTPRKQTSEKGGVCVGPTCPINK